MPLYMVRLPKRRSRVIGKSAEEFKVGDRVIVDSEFGPIPGVIIGKVEEGSSFDLPLVDIKGKFDGKIEDREAEREAILFCQRKALEMDLPMRFVRCENVLDGSKVVFYFVAPTRVDFRELLKVLAKRFRKRIELRQIGIRDAVKMLGGIGPCGYEVCCSRFIDSFESISIRMAKDQNLILNPDKISGPCGKLLCCLMYEEDLYRESKKEFPEIGSKVRFYGSTGVVVGHNVLNRSIMVEDEEGHRFLVPLDEIEMEKKDA